MATNTVDIINAVAGLWKLVLAIGLPVTAIVFRKPLQNALAGLRNLRFKQGQTEVSFERSAAQDKPESTPGITAAVAPAPEKQEQPEEPAPAQPGDYFFQMHLAFFEERFDDAEDAFNHLQEAEESQDNRLANECIYLFLRYRHVNDTNVIGKLEKMAEKPKVRARALYWIAACHEFSRSYAKASATYKRSLADDLDDKVRARHTVALAKCLVQINNPQEALQEITGALGRITSEEGKAALYQGIADVYEATGNNTLRAVALQKVLHFTPENTDVLFSSAYALSQAEISALCATNYSTLLRFKPKYGIALNNLGVECDKLGLPLMSVSCYKKSAEQKETLAMANLAYRYMNQGFEKDAREILDQAIQEKDPHKNVGQALVSLAERREREDKEWESITSLSLKEQQFFWDYAEASFEPCKPVPSFSGNWEGSDGKLISLSHEGDKLTGKWETEKDGEEIQGNISRCAAQIMYKRKSQSLGLSSYWGDAETGFAFLSVDGNRIEILILSKKAVRFLTLTRRTDSEGEVTE